MVSYQSDCCVWLMFYLNKFPIHKSLIIHDVTHGVV